MEVTGIMDAKPAVGLPVKNQERLGERYESGYHSCNGKKYFGLTIWVRLLVNNRLASMSPYQYPCHSVSPWGIQCNQSNNPYLQYFCTQDSALFVVYWERACKAIESVNAWPAMPKLYRRGYSHNQSHPLLCFLGFSCMFLPFPYLCRSALSLHTYSSFSSIFAGCHLWVGVRGRVPLNSVFSQRLMIWFLHVHKEAWLCVQSAVPLCVSRVLHHASCALLSLSPTTWNLAPSMILPSDLRSWKLLFI